MGYPLFYMDNQNHTNIMIDRINLCCYKIAKTVFYFADLFKLNLYDAIYLFIIVRNITNNKNI